MIGNIRNDILEIFNPSDQLSIGRATRLVHSILASSVYSTFARLFCARFCRSSRAISSFCACVRGQDEQRIEEELKLRSDLI